MKRETKLIICCLILLIILVFTGFCWLGSIRTLEAENKSLKSQINESNSLVYKGEYTIFYYTQNGWTNRLYVTEFYIENDIVFYKLRELDYETLYLPVKFDDCLVVKGWIEDINELINYGFWRLDGVYDYSSF